MTNQLTYTEASEQLRAAYEQEKIQLTAHISTLEVAVGQQTIKIKKLEERILEIEKDWQEGWDLADSYNLKIEELKEELGVDNN